MLPQASFIQITTSSFAGEDFQIWTIALGQKDIISQNEFDVGGLQDGFLYDSIKNISS